MSGLRAALSRRVRGLGVRLLLVNVVVVLVPWAGLEYARWHERRLLSMLESGMRDQAVLVRAIAEGELAAGTPLGSPLLGDALHRAAVETRTRVRVLDARGHVLLDSHDHGPPEGPEVPSVSWLSSASRSASAAPWPDLPARREVRDALEGRASAMTRVRDSDPSVLLFLSEPVRDRDAVVGAVYVTRSTAPVLAQMHTLRRRLVVLLAVSLSLTSLVTLVLAWTITRPLSRLASVARRISRGELGVDVPRGGAGEVADVAEAVATLVREQERRLRHITEFTADVAHELKSPLTSIKGAAELLSDGVDDASRARFLANIGLDAERLDRLVSRLLELSRVDAPETPLEDVAVDPVIARVLGRTHGVEQPVIRSGAEGLVVRAREQDLERALLNLVENALRFAPPGTPVRIEVGKRGPRIELAVEDEGPGVPEADRERVFARFFTTDSERTGTGLGLAIVRGVAERAGGSASLVRSERGARFVMSLRAA